jgi:DNA-binding GntR family transcriptional regulator
MRIVSIELQADRALLDRTSRAEKVADILRNRILEGYFRPGQRLNELEIVDGLGVSRNTLREAYRLLTHEGLLAQELNRGMFVRMPTVDDVTDIYRVRRLVECGAVRALTPAAVAPGGPSYDAVQELGAIVTSAEQALDADLRAVGTANVQFHQRIAALNGSTRIDELMSRLSAELRLVFQVMDDPRRFHAPYVARNRELHTLIAAGDGPAAERHLDRYLTDAERQLVEALSS